MRTIRELVKVYHNGDKMTDDELVDFNEHMTTTTELLENLGPEYRIHANHTREIARNTLGFMKVRHVEGSNPIVARPVSLKELIDAGVVFESSDEKEESGVVAEGYVVRDSDDDRLECYTLEPNGEYSVGYRTSGGCIDGDEKCFVVFKFRGI